MLSVSKIYEDCCNLILLLVTYIKLLYTALYHIRFHNFEINNLVSEWFNIFLSNLLALIKRILVSSITLFSALNKTILRKFYFLTS